MTAQLRRWRLQSYDLEGDHHPPLIVDYKKSDNDDNNNDSNIAGVNVLPISPPRKLPVDEPSQAPDSNKNATDVV